MIDNNPFTHTKHRASATNGQTPCDKLSRPSVRLADLSWQEAERLLTPDTLIILPLGAAAKEHGPHLRLDNDYRLAEALSGLVMQRTPVIVAPTVSFHHYPAFTSYPGSVSLRFNTARDLIVDIIGSLAAFGPRRFYVLNTGVWGDPTLADADKGKRVVEAIVEGIVREIEALRRVAIDSREPGAS